jgi:alkylation response protein AidB-like acyl-CoA dehydrogenase
MIRMQFGKPIASFQSMKHKQADMLLEVELAKSAAYYAAASLDDRDDVQQSANALRVRHGRQRRPAPPSTRSASAKSSGFSQGDK